MPQKFLPEEAPLPLVSKSEPVTLSLFAESEEIAAAERSAAVTVLLARAKVSIRRQRLRYWVRIAFSQLLMQVSILFLVVNLSGYLTSAVLKILLCSIVGGIASFIGYRWSKRPSRGEMNELIHRGGIHAIAPLLDSLRFNDCEAENKSFRNALTTLLPLLKASDANILTPANRVTLYEALRPAPYEPDPDVLHLQLVILKALEQVGDEKAYPVVKRLVNLKDSPRNLPYYIQRFKYIQKKRFKYIQKIRPAAQECLLHLESRRGDDTARMTLLRGSTVEAAAPETLLRPAAPTDTDAADQLLRPTDTE